MIKAEVTESSISIFQGLNRVDAAIARQGSEVDILFNGISISLGDIITELTS